MPVDIEVNAKSLPTNAPDPDVKIPESVRRAAAAAEAIHAQAYQTADPANVSTSPADAPVDSGNTNPISIVEEPPPADPRETVRRARKAKVAAAPAPQPEPPAPAPQPEPPAPHGEPEVTADEAMHRYRSMKGRYEASQAVIGQMQEQMTMLGNELARTQHLMMQGTQQPPPPATSLITDADKQAYGDDLIDLTKRAAQEAVRPQLEELQQENQRLQQAFLRERQVALVQALDSDMPDWREINHDIRFKRWLSLPDIYSGVVRKKMLDAAYAAASAPRVLAFFKGFIQDEVATGNIEPEPQPEPQVAPRQAAVPLERLSAPGKARPAGGNPPAPASDTPIFTRAQIAKFYENVRKGAYAGRDAQRQADEAAIFAAQNAGRVR